MKKSTIKLLAVILVALILVASVYTIVNASTPTKATDVSAYTMFQNASDSTGASGTANKIIGSLITVIQIIGVGVAIIMLVVLAIKYISAAPGDKAEIKKHAVVYVVGAIVLFAASGILGIIKQFAATFTET